MEALAAKGPSPCGRCGAPPPLPFSPRRRVTRISHDILTKEMIGRAFNRSMSPRSVSEDLNFSSRSLGSSGTVAVECGLGLSPRRACRTTMSRGRMMTPTRKQHSFKKSKLLNSIEMPLHKPEKTEQLPASSIGSASSLRPMLQKQISCQSLQNIQDHKSSIAEMRPRRRKVQFNCDNEDVRTQTATSRILGLTLRDLSLHVGSPTAAADEQLSVAGDSLSYHDFDEEDDERAKIGKLENQIRKQTDMTERYDELIEEDQALAEQLQAENKILRRKLVSSMQIPIGRQTQKQMVTRVNSLKSELKALELQIKALKCRQNEE